MGNRNDFLYESFKERELEILRLMNDGLNSREIAERLVIGVATVRWYIKQIYSKLDVHSREEALVAAQALGLLVGIPHSGRETPALRHNLPAQLTSFIGRQKEIATVRQLLAETRLLTLSGPGGVGKTRLALHVVQQVTDDFSDGTYFIGLSSITNPALVAKTIANTLVIIENSNEALTETLKRTLAQREVLLLIDNFEHVLVAAPLISDLLSANPNLKIVATSREALRLYGEYEYIVPPMRVPDAQKQSFDELAQNEVVSLFIQRMRAIKSSFTLSDENITTIVAICARLEGLPLAIELAAARCKLLTPQAVLELLQNSLAILTGGARDAPDRQRTLRATIDWSYKLLDAEEKQIFAHLSVFHGGRTLEAIETVCGADLSMDILDILSSLVDKSLVQQEEGVGGEPRFVMLETLQEYAYEHLQESGDTERVHRLHAEYFVTLAERIEPKLHHADQIFWLDRLDEEHDNLRTALEWSLMNSKAELALRLIGALGWFWDMRSHTVEGYRWAQRALDQGKDIIPSVHAKALIITGDRLLLNSSDSEAKRKALEEGLNIARENDDQLNVAWALFGLTLVELLDLEHSSFQAVERLCSEALTIYRDLGDITGIGWALNGLGEVNRLRGKVQDAEAFYEEGLSLFEATGNHRGASMILNNMAFVAYHQHQFQRAKNLFQQANALQLLVGRQEEHASTLTGMAGIIAAQDEPERATRLLAAADTLLETLGVKMVVAENVDYQLILSEVRNKLDHDTFERCWDEGRALSLDNAFDNAFGE